MAPQLKAPPPRRSRPAAGPRRIGPRRRAAHERSVEAWGGGQLARLSVAAAREMKVTETQKSSAELATERAGLICAHGAPSPSPASQLPIRIPVKAVPAVLQCCSAPPIYPISGIVALHVLVQYQYWYEKKIRPFSNAVKVTNVAA